MRKTFEYESDSQPNPAKPEACATIRVVLHLECRDPEGHSASFEIEGLENLCTGEVLEFEDLPPNEQRAVCADARRLAKEYAAFAYQEYAEGLADYYNDRTNE